MAKYSGTLGLLYPEVETAPGIWSPSKVKEVPVKGDTLNLSKSYSNSDQSVNDDLSVSKRISLILPSDIFEDLGCIRYATYLGQRWKITNVDFQRPRVIFTLGGIWNGRIPEV